MNFSNASWWQRLVLIVLAPVVLPISFLAILAILLPVALWNLAVLCCYWVRYQLTGKAIPPKGPKIDPELLPSEESPG